MSNPVMRWQIVSPTPDKVTEFYCALFDWQATRDNLLHAQMIDTCSEEGIQGSIWPAPPEAPTFAQLFIEVDDCAAYVARAATLGAKVLIAPQHLPDGDVMAILHDPAGMSFGILQSAKP
jgi:predicted enzyme related to lactoylglutathione lyase